jgi:predicted phosphoadenosine phosphosulfate sulfurtransferase
MSATTKTVLEAAQERVAWTFDRFARVVVSVSGGKDSTVLLYLALDEGRRRGREVEVFFLDQEAEYKATIDVIDGMMRLPGVRPVWVQVPIRMTNATSHLDVWLNAWAAGETWMRPRSDLGIAEMSGAPDRFYDFFPWFEKQHENTGFLVGLRSRESLNRWRAVAKNPGVDGLYWTSAAKGAGNARVYPLFDWTSGAIWKFIADRGVPYNAVYDQMFRIFGANERRLRVSNLIHEQAFRSLGLLQEIEPDTYERLLRRLRGVHAAALYALDEQVFGADRLPPAHPTWHGYRDYLLDTTPSDYADRFRRRFAGHPSDEATCRGHVRQILTNDWENNVPVLRPKAEKLKERWWNRL